MICVEGFAESYFDGPRQGVRHPGGDDDVLHVRGRMVRSQVAVVGLGVGMISEEQQGKGRDEKERSGVCCQADEGIEPSAELACGRGGEADAQEGDRHNREEHTNKQDCEIDQQCCPFIPRPMSFEPRMRPHAELCFQVFPTDKLSSGELRLGRLAG